MKLPATGQNAFLKDVTVNVNENHLAPQLEIYAFDCERGDGESVPPSAHPHRLTAFNRVRADGAEECVSGAYLQLGYCFSPPVAHSLPGTLHT